MGIPKVRPSVAIHPSLLKSDFFFAVAFSGSVSIPRRTTLRARCRTRRHRRAMRIAFAIRFSPSAPSGRKPWTRCGSTRGMLCLALGPRLPLTPRTRSSELNSRFDWSSESGAGRSRREAPAPAPNATQRATAFETQTESTPASTALRARKSRSRGSRGRDRAASIVSSVAPPYSRIELTHVRTFYVYEAVKVADGRFGGMR